METWKTNRYPHCKEITDIMDKVSRFDKIASSVYKIINRKIRLRLEFLFRFIYFLTIINLRDNTRCQKIDNRYEFAELERLQLELIELNIEDESLEKSIKVLLVLKISCNLFLF